MTKLEQDGDVKIIADTRTLKGTEQALAADARGLPLRAGRLHPKEPEHVQALTNAIVRADKWIQSASPQDVLRTVPESYLLADKALYLLSFNKVKRPSRRTESSRMPARKTRSKSYRPSTPK